jgi:hypothetical protein
MTRSGRKHFVSGRMASTACLVTLSLGLQGCFIFDFFGRKGGGSGGGGAVSGVLGQPLGSQAGGKDDAALAALYAVTTDVAPAAVRPDPDLMVRRLLRQFRPEGTTVARETGRVENFRLLLGGASEDFQTAPAETYDATSLLATLKVAEEICTGLVAPTSWQHPGWSTILPAAPRDLDTNLRWLAQRMTGVPSGKIADDSIASLRAITEDTADGDPLAHEHYVPACATLAVDAASLLL